MKLLVGQPVVENVARHCESQIRSVPGADAETHPRARHLVLAQVGDNQLLPAQLVGALDARRQHRMALRRIAADDQHQPGLLDVGDRTGVAAVTHRAEEPVVAGAWQ
jgi:hypothetical protein